MMRRNAVLLLLVLQAACSFDLAAPGGTGQPSMSVEWETVEGVSELSVSLRTGVDPATLADALPIEVDGREVLPSGTTPSLWRYVLTEPGAAVHIRGPHLPHNSFRPDVSIEQLTLHAPDTLRLTSSGASILVTGISAGDGGVTARDFISPRVTVRTFVEMLSSNAGLLASVTGTALTGTLHVPTAVLPPFTRDGTLRATVKIQQVSDSRFGSYRFSANRTVSITRPFVVVD